MNGERRGDGNDGVIGQLWNEGLGYGAIGVRIGWPAHAVKTRVQVMREAGVALRGPTRGVGVRIDPALLDAVRALALPVADGGAGLGPVNIGRRLGIHKNKASAAIGRLRDDGRLPPAVPRRPEWAKNGERAGGEAALEPIPCNICERPFPPANRFIRFCDGCRAGGLLGASGFPRQWEDLLAW